MTERDEIIIAMNNVSTKKAKAKNVPSTALINCHKINVRNYYSYILYTVLLAIILLLMVFFICYHYAK